MVLLKRHTKATRGDVHEDPEELASVWWLMLQIANEGVLGEEETPL